MNLFELARIKDKPDWRQTYQVRQERIKKEGSEYFTWAVPSTAAAGAISGIEIAHQFPRARKYLPLDFIEVMNNDAVNVTLIINGKETLPVPASAMRTVVNKALWEVAIRNDDALVASTLNDIIVSLRREPMTADKLAQKVG